ncbi:MAG: hypothetical protein Q9220_006298 [cf. Caloplaca sp. 1 TL-2023]
MTSYVSGSAARGQGIWELRRQLTIRAGELMDRQDRIEDLERELEYVKAGNKAYLKKVKALRDEVSFLEFDVERLEDSCIPDLEDRLEEAHSTIGKQASKIEKLERYKAAVEPVLRALTDAKKLASKISGRFSGHDKLTQRRSPLDEAVSALAATSFEDRNYQEAAVQRPFNANDPGEQDPVGPKMLTHDPAIPPSAEAKGKSPASGSPKGFENESDTDSSDTGPSYDLWGKKPEYNPFTVNIDIANTEPRPAIASTETTEQPQEEHPATLPIQPAPRFGQPARTQLLDLPNFSSGYEQQEFPEEDPFPPGPSVGGQGRPLGLNPRVRHRNKKGRRKH